MGSTMGSTGNRSMGTMGSRLCSTGTSIMDDITGTVTGNGMGSAVGPIMRNVVSAQWVTCNFTSKHVVLFVAVYLVWRACLCGTLVAKLAYAPG